MREFIESIHWGRLELQRIPGTAIFLNATRETVPLALRTMAELNHVLQEQVVVVTVQILPVAVYNQPDRVVVDDLGYSDDGISHVTGKFGYTEKLNVPALLEVADGRRGVNLTAPPEECAYFVSRINIARSLDPTMVSWRKRLYIHLSGICLEPGRLLQPSRREDRDGRRSYRSVAARPGVWRGPESNRRHHDFQSCALPTELPRPGGEG